MDLTLCVSCVLTACTQVRSASRNMSPIEYGGGEERNSSVQKRFLSPAVVLRWFGEGGLGRGLRATFLPGELRRGAGRSCEGGVVKRARAL